MSAKDAFNHDAHANQNGHRAEKVNDNVLYTTFQHNGWVRQYCYFDFLTRTLTILVQNSKQDRTLLFSECEQGMLELHRQKLIELGGDPLPLTPVLDKPSKPNNGLRQLGL